MRYAEIIEDDWDTNQVVQRVNALMKPKKKTEAVLDDQVEDLISEAKPRGGVKPLTPEKARKRAAKQAKINQDRSSENLRHQQKMQSLNLRASQL